MRHDARFRKMLTSAIQRTPAGHWRGTTTRHWFRSSALVIGTALGLVLAGAPPAARSAQTDNQLSIETGNQLSLDTGEVISEITVNAVTQRSCGGPVCFCLPTETLTGGGARCSGRDTLEESFPDTASTWRASCQRLVEVKGAGPTGPVVTDIVRFNVPPAATFALCSTP